MKNNLLPILVLFTSLCQAQNPTLLASNNVEGIKDIRIVTNHNNTPNEKVYMPDIVSNFTNGQNVVGSLVEASNGLLYGMTDGGGTHGYGIIFSYDLTSHSFKDIYDFGSGVDGKNPYHHTLVQANNGLLYGMTESGGANNNGTIFSYNISTGEETDIHDFGFGSDRTYSLDSLFQSSNGFIFGVVVKGDINRYSIDFSYDMSTNEEADIPDFNNSQELSLVFHRSGCQ